MEQVHPFYGITFLACKQANLPVGNTKEFSLDMENKRFLEKYYKPANNSKWYYRVFRLSDKNQRWLRHDYASSGLQAINTQTFGNAFIHPKKSKLWGWKSNYIEILKSHLKSHQLIPTFHLAVWLYRDREWQFDTTAESIIKFFFDKFLISEEEKSNLFDISIPENITLSQLFQEQKVSWEELQSATGKPPDAPPEEGGTLAYLEIQGVGPAKKLCFEPAERVSLITGDNGLGKTFLLECAWWALTGQWAGHQAYPTPSTNNNEPNIIFQISGESKSEKESVSYDRRTQRWRTIKNRPTIPGLLIYARVDGSFAVWDPAKEYWSFEQGVGENDGTPRPFVFAKDEVWHGHKDRKGNTYINGLLQDWIQWQSRPEKYPFNTLAKVLERLSPPSQGDLGALRPGEPVRLPFDAKDIPTLEHSYGTVPIVHASAGVQRIITMAYLIVWAWEEHKIQSELIRREPQKRMVILVDELEAHLHPQWQRVILPALLDVREDLTSDLQVQIMIATHSPLVMASVEPRFDAKVDKLFRLNLVKSDLLGNEVELDQLPFIRQGVVDSWLTSDVFELRQARSLEAENAIEAAKALQYQDNPRAKHVQKVSQELAKYLSEDDEFWPRWVFFAEQHGVEL
ncbi:ATP-binding protein [Coleofasciculus sp. FACHB-129]|uniref:AAA family ATPase n=1 Tax=Coleofasciculus sp. FACHB-129 TaxID=2692785 RepID=UPI0016853706|nr:ATP-binding protein [Coleofasciculus sp. FACHB-129]